jgi:N-acetylneuraminate lyase
MTKRPHGLITATYTAFHADGSLNLSVIAKHADLLVRNGVKGVFVCGSTGEGVSMTTDERIAYVNRWCEVGNDSLSVIAHVGHSSLNDARAMAAAAQKSGAHAISTVAPSVLKPANVEDLVEWCAAVASAAPELQYYYYHIPILTTLRFNMVKYMELASQRISNFCGMKFTDEDLFELGRCVDWSGGKHSLYFGRDEILLSGLVVGVQGAVGSTYNYSAPVYNRVMAAFEKGDMKTAMQEQARARESVQILNDFGGGAGKAMLRTCGIDCGPMRLPKRSITPEAEKQLLARLDAFGWDEVRCR